MYNLILGILFFLFTNPNNFKFWLAQVTMLQFSENIHSNHSRSTTWLLLQVTTIIYLQSVI